MMKSAIFVLLPVALALVGCKSTPKPVEQDPMQSEVLQKKFQTAMHTLEQERYKEAIPLFEKILVEHPATEFDLIVLYNLGAAFEGAGECQKAAERYRQVAHSSGKAPRIEANAILRLSYTSECLGHDDKVITNLLDLRTRAKYLTDDIVKAEIPARMAGAYARLGNRKEAEKFFNQALKGVQFLQVKYKDSRQLADTLAQNLYFMGRANVPDSEWAKQPVAQLKGLAITQLYLLQAAELGSAKWSGKAVDEILDSYQMVWKLLSRIDGSETSDAQIKARDREAQQAAILKEALRGVRSLKAQKMPSRSEPPIVQRLFSELDNQEQKIMTQLANIGVDNPLTAESEERNGLKRKGKIKAANPSVLEKGKKAPESETE